MAEITLSNAVRNNLLSLQNTADLLGKTQNRLSTGLKVNSALDDPTAFFTASSLNSRAGDLNRLLDSVGNAVQTVRAADNGISAITKLVESAQATARQALQKPGPASTTTAATATGSVTVTANTAAKSTGSVSLGADVSATVSSATIADDAAVAALTGTLTITGTDGTASLDFDTIATEVALAAAIGAVSTATGTTVAYTAGGTLDVTATGSETFAISGNHAGIGGGIVNGTIEATNAGIAGFTDNAISVTLGSGSAQSIDISSTTNRTDLLSTLNAGLTGVTATIVSNNVVLTADDTSNALTISGATDLGLSSASATNAQLAGFNDTLSVTVGSGSQQDIDLTSVTNREDLLTTVNAGLTGATATLVSNKLVITAGNTSDALAFSSSDGATSLGLSDATASTGSPVNNVDRAALETEFNNLRTQIDQLAGDASYNGVNLLDGDSLSVIFNEGGTSTLSVSGVDFDSAGLGVTAATTGDFQTNTNLNTKLKELDTAIGKLRQQGSTFGSNLSVVEVRQDFTKNLINTLETGAANLTLADTNQEGANMLALQTRQQLSSVALSLASQADQNVLRLF